MMLCNISFEMVIVNDMSVFLVFLFDLDLYMLFEILLFEEDWDEYL